MCFPACEINCSEHDCLQVYGSCSDFIDYCAFDEVYVQYVGEFLSVHESAQTIALCLSRLTLLPCKVSTLEKRVAGDQRGRGQVRSKSCLNKQLAALKKQFIKY